MPKLFTRRTFLAGLGLSALGGGVYVRLIEPRRLEIGRHEIDLSRGRRRRLLKILHLSDFHASPVVSLEFIAKAIDMGLQLQPDLICLTGDFITHKFDEFAAYTQVLSPLAKTAPTFACLGNHDGGLWVRKRRGYEDTERVRQLLADGGVQLLHNLATDLQIKDWNLHLVGLGDLWAKELQPEKAFAEGPADRNATVIALSHNPDSKERMEPYAWDLLLCGHTHGGQLRLPILGTPFAPVDDRRFVDGLHCWRERWIHITRGIGNVHGVRLNCPPEVCLLTLV